MPGDGLGLTDDGGVQGRASLPNTPLLACCRVHVMSAAPAIASPAHRAAAARTPCTRAPTFKWGITFANIAGACSAAPAAGVQCWAARCAAMRGARPQPITCLPRHRGSRRCSRQQACLPPCLPSTPPASRPSLVLLQPLPYGATPPPVVQTCSAPPISSRTRSSAPSPPRGSSGPGSAPRSPPSTTTSSVRAGLATCRPSPAAAPVGPWGAAAGVGVCRRVFPAPISLRVHGAGCIPDAWCATRSPLPNPRPSQQRSGERVHGSDWAVPAAAQDPVGHGAGQGGRGRRGRGEGGVRVARRPAE